MKYFLDTEFLEGRQLKRWLGLVWDGEDMTKPTIDLISIGIVSDDAREYYAVSKDFNFHEAWWRNDNVYPRYADEKPTYWLRDNVLMPIIYELAIKDYAENDHFIWQFESAAAWLEFVKTGHNWEKIWYKRGKSLIKKFGKSNDLIKHEILSFVGTGEIERPKFYGYYADYDWVVFCWLFGYMRNLPKHWPMYCRDLKQMFDDVVANKGAECKWNIPSEDIEGMIKMNKLYPKEKNEHNALADAHFNKELYEFLTTIQI